MLMLTPMPILMRMRMLMPIPMLMLMLMSMLMPMPTNMKCRLRRRLMRFDDDVMMRILVVISSIIFVIFFASFCATNFHKHKIQFPAINQLYFFENVNSTINSESAFTTKSKNCSNDASRMPYLSSFKTFPALNLKPALNLNENTEYYATVGYDVILIAVEALAEHCNATAHLFSKNGPTVRTNNTLGVGLNEIQIKIVDHSDDGLLPQQQQQQQQPLVNTYTFQIFRMRAGDDLPSFSVAATRYPVCKLRQDCSLKFSNDSPCGLEHSPFKSWDDFLTNRRSLPPCSTDRNDQGFWFVPCLSCGASTEKCFWSKARWQPMNCKHIKMSAINQKDCLLNKTILFLGDSTNRGVMHYVIEKTNGSLWRLDKIHETKVYENVNGNRTSVVFSYYPQFWMDADKRPRYGEALGNLLKILRPMANNASTILVIGGVHWLNEHHLTLTHQILQEFGLDKIKVIVKTLGAGFHQRVSGMHYLSQTEQLTLSTYNERLVRRANELDFLVLDTFNMTMARYKDFTEGKCACHFHRVKEVLPRFSRLPDSQTLPPGFDFPIKYHVEGEINSVYSEMLLNLICGR